MQDIVCTSSAVALPQPRVPITTRLATMDDVPFLDGLQKQHHKQLGFFPRAQMEGYIENGWVLVAEDATTRQPLGYCASRDRYLKRDELGVIYQLCVTPGFQRGLIGATLIKEVFERSAYGCRLYCCWCAQDLAANYFWESLGFVPIAFRAGSTGKKRVHIFWQKRIDAGQSHIGDRQSAIPYWYPFQTNAGAIREDRVVFPIPPGTHWRDVVAQASCPCLPVKKKLEKKESNEKDTGRMPVPQTKPGIALMRGFSFQSEEPAAPDFDELSRVAKATKPKAPKPPKAKIDPAFLAKARELRDRWMERVNGSLALPAVIGKYHVHRVASYIHVEEPPMRRLAG